MEDFQFQDPWFLLLLIALPFIQGGVLHLQKKGKERLFQFLSPKNLAELERERWVGGTRRKFILFWVGLAFFAIALARPQANPTVEDIQGASLDIYVLLDVSKSMDAEDLPPSRIKKAKKTIENLLQHLSGDRMGIIAFAGSSIMISPLTADYDVLKLFLSNVDTSLIQNQGTDLAGALQTAFQAMKRGAEKFGVNDRSNVFLVLSDGEDTISGSYDIADQIRESGGIIFSIAYGTEAGASIPIRNIRGELSGYKRDKRGNQVVTKVQPDSLRKVAESSGGNFYFSTLEETEVQDILNRLQGFQRGEAALRKARIYQEYFYIPLLLGILCIVFSFFSARVIFSLSIWKGVFRKTAIILLLAPSAWAGPLNYLYDEQKRNYLRSQELSAAGKTEEAAQQMKELLAENPDSDAIMLNLGIYNAQAKKLEEAEKQFERIIQKSGSLREEALFNSAGNYAANGKIDEARRKYADLLDSLAKKQDLNSKELELLEKTRINLAKLHSDPPPQNQQKNPSGGGGDSNKDQNSNQQKSEGEKGKDGESQQKKDEKDKQDSGKDQKDSDKQDKDGSKNQGDKKDNDQKDEGQSDSDKKDDSDKDGQEDQKEEKKNAPMAGGNPDKKKYLKKNNMAEQDAKRLLEALKQRESGIQKKFMRFNGKGDETLRENNDKDW